MATNDRSRASELPLSVILVILSLFVLMAFETGEAIHDRGALAVLLRGQEPTVRHAIKLRRQLQTLAGKTAELARGGDTAAKTVVDEMKHRGITLSPPGH
ncbi:MAG: hypothetical protein ACREFD_19285 [Stellaceae bacterium]